jgi:replicative DNA helicase
MADLGRALISKIIIEDDLVTAMRAGIRDEWFEDKEHRETYRWMLDYYSRYGETPTNQALKTQFPNYRLLTGVAEPYEYYVDQFRLQRKRVILVDAVLDANAALNDDNSKLAQEELSKGLLRLGKEISALSDENAVAKMRSRYDSYEVSRQNVGVLTGISTGYPTLDLVTSGFQDEQFIILGGAQKQGKSFTIMKSAVAAHDQGKRVLFVSFEMSQFEQLCRYDALTCGINSFRLLHATLDDVDMKKLKMGMRVRRGMQPFIVSADVTASTTMSGLSAKIDQYEPDIVFVDGVYLMENEVGAEFGSSQAYTAISRGLKRLAQRIKKPVVGTTQALPSKMGKDQVVTMHSFAWTSAWAQDADLILGVEQVPDSPIIKLRVVAGRNVSSREIAIACNWEDSIFEEVDVHANDDDDDEDD